MEQRIQKLWRRGLEYFQSGNLDAAQASFEGILAREPRHGPARYRLALIASRRGNTRRAIDLCEQVLSTEPNRAEVLVHLAQSRLATGDADAARAAVARAEKLPRLSAPVLGTLAQLNSGLGQGQRALELYDRAVLASPQEASLRFNRALALRKHGELLAAERELEECLRLKPDHAKAHWVLSELFPRSPRRERLAAMEARLAGLPPGHRDDPYYAYALFHGYDTLGEPARAWPCLQRGLRARRVRQPYDVAGERERVQALIDDAGATQPPATAQPGDPVPIFVFGVPRSGVGLLSDLLAGHSGVHSPPVHTHLANAVGRPGSLRTPQEVRERYLAQAAAPAGTAYLVDRQPMNFLHVPVIRRAFPEARLLHVERDPVDACLSQLSRLFPEHGMAIAGITELADAYRDYLRLVATWHARFPGAMLDVAYESLVDKPEMVLRVVCAFLGLRFERAMLDGHRLGRERAGLAERYGVHVPELVALRDAQAAG